MAARLGLVTVLVVLTSAVANGADVERVPLTLEVCDKVGLDPITRANAKQAAAAILARAGIEVTWLDAESASSKTTFSLNSLENCVWRSNAHTLAVITDGEPEGSPADLMGLAPRSADLFGQRIYVLHHRVKQFTQDHLPAGSENEGLGTILGAVIAHELGHLFVPKTPHTLTGVMRADWGYRQASEAVSGNLSFSKDHAARMRRALQERYLRLLRIENGGV